MTPLLLLAVAFLLGSIPFGYLSVKVTTGDDVRAVGSGNIGATNVLRAAGRTIAIVTLLLDVAKGYVAVWLMARYAPTAFWMSAAAITVMAGHAYSMFLKFRGGKAVASFIGAFLYLTPIPMLAVLLVFVIMVTASGHISVGSVVAAGTFPLAVWLILHPGPPVLLAALLAGVFIIYRHRGNLARIRAGREHVFSFGRTRR